MATQSPSSRRKSTVFEQDSSVPRYYQLKEIIREQIASWEPGQLIPSELELCQMYSVSRTTVRKALDHLTQEGLLYRIQGKGTFVAPPKLRERFVQQAAGIYEDMASRGVTIRTQVLDQAVVPASKLVAPELQLVVGSPVLKLVRLRFVGDEPLLVSTSFLPYRSFPGLENEDFTYASLYAVLREKYGVQLGHGTRLVEAVPCTDEEAKLLHIAPTTPLLVVSGIMYDIEGHPVDYGFARHRGDRSQVEIAVVMR
jgi:GntR family transcriptional regulator